MGQGKTIIIHGGTFIASPIDSPHATVESYVERLKINESSSADEQQLKQLFAELRTAIQEASELKPYERASAVSDLENMTGELTKPAKERQEGALEHYLTRIKAIASKSASILMSVAKIGSFFGLG